MHPGRMARISHLPNEQMIPRVRLECSQRLGTSNMHRQGNTASMVYPQIHNFVDLVGITKQSAFQNLGTGASLDPGTAVGAFCTYR
jgi:hypothetical protein